MRATGLILAAALLAGCTGGSPTPPPPSHTPSACALPPAECGEDVYRTAIEDFGFTSELDPVTEHSPLGKGLLSQLLVRTLVTFRHVAREPGRRLVPDIATTTGKVSNHGLTWTFRLKRGTRFGPPVNRAVTSRDIEYAFERIEGTPTLPATAFVSPDFRSYFDGVIVGMRRRTRAVEDISGIDSSAPRTIVFHLTRPTGDFPMRLALPATAPIPREVAHCFSSDGTYGRDLIATGPYTIAGEDRIDTSSCSHLRPIRGFDPHRRLRLVRNPNYDPATDDPSTRSNSIDGVDIRIDPNTADIFRKIEEGGLDGSIGSTPPPAMRFLHAREHSDQLDALVYLSLNLLWPPFDDIHVRGAVDDRLSRGTIARRLQGIGGAVAGGVIPLGIVPHTLPWGGVDLLGARAEMTRSRHDADGDGRCDPRRRCRAFGIRGLQAAAQDEISRELRSLGLDVRFREIDSPGCCAPQVIALSLQRLTADYPDPFAFARSFENQGHCLWGPNTSNVGVTARRARDCAASILSLFRRVGHSTVRLDPDINRCERLSGAVRAVCWARFQYKLQQLAIWIPLVNPSTITVVGPRVIHYEFDQFSGMISLAHIAMAP